jgi:transposase-like protein
MPPATSTSRVRHSHTLEKKRRIAQEAIAAGNNSATARKYGVNECSIREWVRSLHQLNRVDDKKSKMIHKMRERTPRYPALDEVGRRLKEARQVNTLAAIAAILQGGEAEGAFR